MSRPHYDPPPKADTRELDALVAEWRAADPKHRRELEGREIPVAMQLAGLEEHAGFVLKVVIYARVRAGCEAQAADWLREHGHKNLEKATWNRLQDGKPLPPRELFEVELRSIARPARDR